MIQIEFNGKTYTRNKNKWCDSNYIIAHDSLQKELNTAYCNTLNLSSMSVQEILSEGDSFKNSSSVGLAIKLYLLALEAGNEKDISFILPRLTSCYRKQGAPHKAIEVFSQVKKKYGSGVFSPVLLTSAAAAYCDLEEYDNALKCCNNAYKMCNGKASGELDLVYKRIKSKTD